MPFPNSLKLPTSNPPATQLTSTRVDQYVLFPDVSGQMVMRNSQQIHTLYWKSILIATRLCVQALHLTRKVGRLNVEVCMRS